MALEHQLGFKRLDVSAPAVEHFRWVTEVVGRLPRERQRAVEGVAVEGREPQR